jgi:GT2 family glycosyltransferase
MLRECLDSVIASAHAGTLITEIILVDNASRSRICDWAVECFPSITVLRFEYTVGFSTGNNAAFRISKGRYLLQLNNDTVVDSTALRRMVDFLDAHPEAGAVGPRLVNPDGTLQVGYYARAFPTITYNAFHLFWIHRWLPNNASFRNQMLLDQPDVTREVDQPAGAALFYRREALFSLGLLDDDYTFAFDDVDICFRLWRAGWRIDYLAEAQVTHYGGVSLSKSTADMTNYYLTGLLTFYWKNSSPPTFLLMRLIVIAAILFRIPIIFIVAYLFGKKRWRGNIRNYFHYLALLLQSLVSGYRSQLLPIKAPTVIATPTDPRI